MADKKDKIISKALGHMLLACNICMIYIVGAVGEVSGEELGKGCVERVVKSANYEGGIDVRGKEVVSASGAGVGVGMGVGVGVELEGIEGAIKNMSFDIKVDPVEYVSSRKLDIVSSSESVSLREYNMESERIGREIGSLELERGGLQRDKRELLTELGKHRSKEVIDKELSALLSEREGYEGLLEGRREAIRTDSNLDKEGKELEILQMESEEYYGEYYQGLGRKISRLEEERLSEGVERRGSIEVEIAVIEGRILGIDERLSEKRGGLAELERSVDSLKLFSVSVDTETGAVALDGHKVANSVIDKGSCQSK